VPLSTGPIEYYSKDPIDPSDYIHSKEALVGVFDFLGFKKLMSNPNLFEITSNICGISNLVRRCGTDAKKSFEVNGKISNLSPELIQISDTFIVYNISRDPPSVKHFLWNVHDMMFYAILAGFPLRGAITTGEIFIKKDRSLFLGEALQEAFELEKMQIWSGACIGSSLQQYINNVGLLDALFPQILPYAIPFEEIASRNLKSKPQMALNWIDEINRIIPDYIIEKFPPFSNSDEEKKAINTRSFLEFASGQIAKCKKDWAPINRRINYIPAPDLGGSIVNFSYGDKIRSDDGQ
jgi:hypothetical protein